MRNKSQNEAENEYELQLQREAEEELNNHSADIEVFIQFALTKHIQITKKNFDFFRPIGVIVQSPNIFVSLAGIEPDKEGLFLFRDLLQSFKRLRCNSGNLYSDNFIVLSSRYFRRGFHEGNNYAPRFLEYFWGLDHYATDTFLALDTDRVRVNINEYSYVELDTWYGARFNRNVGDIPDGVVKLRPPMDLEPFRIRFFFANAYSLDVKWSTAGAIRNFYLEEFKTEQVTVDFEDNSYYPARYIHAEFDTEKNVFRHFDGAIHFYTKDEYFNRRDSDFNYNHKSDWLIKTKSKKLFKINGDTTVDTWIVLCSHFLIGNPLIFEYFEGKYPVEIEEALERINEQRENSKSTDPSAEN